MKNTGKIRWFLAFLVVTAACTWAQAPAAPDSGTVQTAQPTPDKDGVYSVGPGITSPRIVEAAPATPPDAIGEADRPRLVRLTAVIDVDGSVRNIEVVNPSGDPLQDAAAAAVRASKFAPGTLNGNPVPVLVCIRVPFLRLAAPVPRLGLCLSAGGLGVPAGTTPPRAINAPVPEYSNEARKKKIQGVVLISTLVDEQGMPTDIRVEKSLGYGLDEKAIECVSRYRFSPATRRDGTPVAMRVTIETSFRFF